MGSMHRVGIDRDNRCRAAPPFLLLVRGALPDPPLVADHCDRLHGHGTRLPSTSQFPEPVVIAIGSQDGPAWLLLEPVLEKCGSSRTCRARLPGDLFENRSPGRRARQVL